MPHYASRLPSFRLSTTSPRFADITSAALGLNRASGANQGAERIAQLTVSDLMALAAMLDAIHGIRTGSGPN